MKTGIFCLIVFLIFLFSCETTVGPNEIGGNTDLELTEIGNEFGLYFELRNLNIDGLDGSELKDSIAISENNNGIVRFRGYISTNIETVNKIDTFLGTQNLPKNSKDLVLEAYKQKYGINYDTLDQNNLKLIIDTKLKITSEGIQDFFHAKGDETKPFTIVKYSSNVGDKYEFTNTEGKKIVRTVIQKNPDEDWDIAFWRVKTIRVEEELIDDPLADKVIYVCNHKFGLVGLIIHLKNGKILDTTVMPPTL